MKRLITVGLIVMLFVMLGCAAQEDRIPEEKKLLEIKVGDPDAPAPENK